MNGAAIYGAVTPSAAETVNYWNFYGPLGDPLVWYGKYTIKEIIDLYNRAVTEFARIKAGGTVYIWKSLVQGQTTREDNYTHSVAHAWYVATTAERDSYITALFNDINNLSDFLSYAGIQVDGENTINTSKLNFDSKGNLVLADGQLVTSQSATQKKSSSPSLILLAGGAVILFLLYKSI